MRISAPTCPKRYNKQASRCLVLACTVLAFACKPKNSGTNNSSTLATVAPEPANETAVTLAAAFTDSSRTQLALHLLECTAGRVGTNTQGVDLDAESWGAIAENPHWVGAYMEVDQQPELVFDATNRRMRLENCQVLKTSDARPVIIDFKKVHQLLAGVRDLPKADNGKLDKHRIFYQAAQAIFLSLRGPYNAKRVLISPSMAALFASKGAAAEALGDALNVSARLASLDALYNPCAQLKADKKDEDFAYLRSWRNDIYDCMPLNADSELYTYRLKGAHDPSADQTTAKLALLASLEEALDRSLIANATEKAAATVNPATSEQLPPLVVRPRDKKNPRVLASATRKIPFYDIALGQRARNFTIVSDNTTAAGLSPIIDLNGPTGLDEKKAPGDLYRSLTRLFQNVWNGFGSLF